MKDTVESEWLAGKVLSLSTGHDTLALKNARIESINDRVFVRGEIPEGATKKNWAKGLSSGVAWDSVTDFMIFESEAEYLERMGISNGET